MMRKALATAAILTVSSRALAVDSEISSETSAQFYDVRSPSGEIILPRRRLTSTLAVSAYDLMPRGPAVVPDFSTKRFTGEISFRARLRYDADYGGHPGEAAPNDYDRFVPGFARAPVDLMYGYVEGRRLFGGFFGFKLGRQYTTDALGWWSFDGGLVRVTTPAYFAIEALGGLEVRGGMPLATSRFERDGVWRGNRDGFDPSLYPSFQPSEVAPAMGAAIESVGLPWAHSRLSYRRVYNTGRSNVSSFASGTNEPVSYDGTRISSERIGYAIEGNAPEYGGAKGGLAYDLYSARFTSLFASVDGYVTPRLTLSADYDFYAPSYDGDSIWNFFVGNPMNDIGVRAAWDAPAGVSFAAGTNARVFAAETGPSNASTSVNATAQNSYFPPSGTTFDGGGFVAARRRIGSDHYGFRANVMVGREGHRNGGEVFGEHTLQGRTILVGRASVWEWEDRLRPHRAAGSVGLVAGLGYRIDVRARTQLEYQLDMNRLSGLRSRVVLWLTVATR